MYGHMTQSHMMYSHMISPQAKIAFQKKDYQKAETFLLRADRADLAATFYKVTMTT